MKIQFLRTQDDKHILVRFTIDGLGDLDFYRASASTIETRLLRDKIYNEFSAQMENVRSVSYRRGWKHRGSHKKDAKKSGFATCAEVLDWERKEAE